MLNIIVKPYFRHVQKFKIQSTDMRCCGLYFKCKSPESAVWTFVNISWNLHFPEKSQVTLQDNHGIILENWKQELVFARRFVCFRLRFFFFFRKYIINVYGKLIKYDVTKTSKNN